MDELKKLMEDFQKVFTEFRSANDERIKTLESKGRVDPLLEGKVDKLNERIDELNTKMADLHTRANRVPLYGPDGQVVNQLTEHEERHMKAVALYLRKGAGTDELADLEKRAQQANLDEDAGYLLAKPTVGRIVAKVYETTLMRQICHIETISSDKLQGPIDNDEAESGWVGETQTRSETGTPSVGMWEIPVHEIYAEPKQSQRFLDDAAVDVEGWLTGKVSARFSRQENSAFCVGNGVNKPRGLTKYDTAATADSSRAWGTVEHIASGASGDFGATDPSDKLIDIIYALKPEYRSNAKWLMPRAVQAKIRKFKDGNDQYLWQPGLVAGQPASLMGYSIVEAEDMPALAANSLSLAFGNFQEAYTIVDRIGIRTIRDNVTLKGWVKFYTTKRVGGGVVNFEAYKLMKFAA
jgi:HK97 family phage major capsid protein